MSQLKTLGRKELIKGLNNTISVCLPSMWLETAQIFYSHKAMKVLSITLHPTHDDVNVFDTLKLINPIYTDSQSNRLD